MTPARLARLADLLHAVAEAERLRLAGLIAGIAECRASATRLRRLAAAAVPEAEPAVSAGDLAVFASWRAKLLSGARDAESRAAGLEAEAGPLRKRYARAFGRARAVAALAGKARSEARRMAERRAEGMGIPSSAQSPGVSSGAAPGAGSAGSPAIT